jgi:hypothetical protein
MLQVLESWFLLYVFLFLGAYGKDFLDFVLYDGTVQRCSYIAGFVVVKTLALKLLIANLQQFFNIIHQKKNNFLTFKHL